METAAKFEVGEEVWFYPLGKDFRSMNTPKEGHRVKREILRRKFVSDGWWYEIYPHYPIPTFCSESSFDKVEKMELKE